jgi:surfeit locus 1 family protein
LLHFYKNIRLPWLIFTLLVFALLVKLAFWQWSRADLKQRRLDNIANYAQQQALSLTQVLSLMQSNQPEQYDINDLLLTLEGEFDAEHLLLLDNQTNQGKLGYRVLQVLTVPPYALLVNLGWVAGSINRNILPDIEAIAGQHRMLGHIRVPELGIVLAEQSFKEIQWPLRIDRIELDKISKIVGKQLLPFVLYLDKKELLGFEKNWQPIVMPPEKHRAYAFQWFSLAIAWLVLMIWATIKNNNKKAV